jgi:hypothetical protein
MGAATTASKPRFNLNPWRELTGLSIVLIEVTWLTLWFRSLSFGAAQVPTFQTLVIFALMMFSAYLLARNTSTFTHTVWSRRLVYLMYFGGWVALGSRLLISQQVESNPGALLETQLRSFADFTRVLPGELFAIAAVLLAGWRGHSLLQRRLSQDSVISALQTGLIAIALYLFAAAFLDSALPEYWLLLLYLSAGLFGVGAGRIAAIGLMRGARKTAFNRQWLGSLASSVAATVALASGLVGLFLAQFSALVAELSAIVQAIALALVLIVVSPILFAFQLLLPDAQPVSVANEAVIPTPAAPDFELAPGPANDSGYIGSILANDAGLPPEVRLGFYWLGIIGLIVVVVWMMRSRAIRSWLRPEEEIENLDRPGSLWKQLRELFASARRSGKGAEDGGFDDRDRQRAAARIRQIYTDLMEVAASSGYPRLEAQTPLEYLPVLRKAFNTQHAELASITQAYLQVRYGELPESRADVEMIEQAWRILKAAASTQQA